ncbi:MAG: hypothetical protein AB1445_09525 [Bacillota bacterium]
MPDSWAEAASLVLGLLGALTPCSIPTVVAMSRAVRGITAGLLFSLGMVAGFWLVGIVAGLAASAVDAHVLERLTAAVMAASGLYLVVTGRAPAWLRRRLRSRVLAGPVAFLAGVPFAILSDPCAVPVIVSLAAYAAARSRPGILGYYAAGRCLPLFLISRTGLSCPRRPWSHRLAGGILLLTAAYIQFLAH